MTIILLEWTSDVLRSAFVVVLYGALGGATQKSSALVSSVSIVLGTGNAVYNATTAYSTFSPQSLRVPIVLFNVSYLVNFTS